MGKVFSNLKFKMRFLKFYILFGVIGLIIEFIIRYLILKFYDNDFYATIIGISLGILFAYWSNTQFNFQIPRHRLRRALFLFIVIGVFSKLLQIIISNTLGISYLNYEIQRLITSALIFLLFYFINVQFTFSNTTKLGIAIYANVNEKVNKVYSKVLMSPDFIQIDLVDNTMYEDAVEVDLNVVKSVNEYWRGKYVELHLMSKDIDRWLKQLEDLFKYIDMIIFSQFAFENDLQIIKEFKNKNPKVDIGAFFKNNADVKTIKEVSKYCSQITIMGIEELGYSGQSFSENTYSILKKIDKLTNRKEFRLEVDGGINSSNFYKLKVDKIVSASSVLESENSINKVLEFKKL